MSINKYHGLDRGGPRHGNQNLFWPGTADGFPAIGPANVAANLKKEEFENLDIRLDFKSQMFELWDAAQKAEFDDINDRIVNSWYYLQKRSDHWDEEHKHYRVWLEWCQVYGMVPTANNRG